MLKFAIQNLMSRKMRSLLALLGLSVAIMGMVGLFSIARGIDRMVYDTFGRIPGLIVMQLGAPMPLFSRLPAGWKDKIEAVEGVNVANEEIWTRVNVIDGKMILSPPRFLFGTTIESRLRLKPSQGVYRDAIEKGRFLNIDDRGTTNIIVSRQIAAEFNKGVGDILRVNGHDATIVGIYHCGSLLLDVTIIIDIEQLRSMTQFDAGTISSIYIEPTGEIENDLLATRVEDVFRGQKFKFDRWKPSIAAGDMLPMSGYFVGDLLTLLGRYFIAPSTPQQKVVDDISHAASSITSTSRTVSPDEIPKWQQLDDHDLPIEVRSASDWAERFDNFSSDLDIILAIMTGIGITIAILSIINTMLMSVSERIIEFGILRANGWSKSDIMKLITFESAVLGVGGGMIGCVLGWVGTLLVNWKWADRIELYASPGLLMFGLAFSTLLGILGGLYPAIWATRMMPMDAIRRG